MENSLSGRLRPDTVAPAAVPPPANLRGLSLLQKGLLIIFVPLLFQAALLATLFNQQRRQTYAQEMAVHTKDVLQSLDAILERLLVMQSDLRGELLGLPAELEGAGEAQAELPAQLQHLRDMMADNPEQVQRAKQLDQRIQERTLWTSEMRSLMVGAGRAEAQVRFERGEGADTMRAIRSEIEAMRGIEERLDRERLEALRAQTRVFQLLLISGLVLDVAFAGGAMWIVARSIGRRMRRLTENIERMKIGDTLLPATSVPDELGELDRSFHQMASGLRAAQVTERESQETIERHNAELTRANHELKQKSQENEMFVYSVSHDLRSPLVNLQGFSKELGMVRNDLREILSKPLDAQEQARGLRMVERDISEPIAFIQTAVTRLSAIIDALLRLSRAGRVEYVPTQTEIQPIIQRVVDALRNSITQKQAQVTVGELPPAWGDRTALEQIFANLLVNSVNYLDVTRPGVIEVGAQPTDETGTTYFVRDNGLGIAAAHLPKLFGAFQRLHEKVAPGEGVGLALVRRVVERHGGKIWAESEENVGTTFFVHLPLEADSPLQVTPKKETLSAHLPTRSTELAGVS